MKKYFNKQNQTKSNTKKKQTKKSSRNILFVNNEKSTIY